MPVPTFGRCMDKKALSHAPNLNDLERTIWKEQSGRTMWKNHLERTIWKNHVEETMWSAATPGCAGCMNTGGAQPPPAAQPLSLRRYQCTTSALRKNPFSNVLCSSARVY